MRYVFICLTSIFLMVMSIIGNAETSAITLYDSPVANSKVVATVPAGQLLIPIFQQNDWVKVANPKNGDVGWVQKINLGQTPTLTITEQSPGVQQYVITQKNKDGTSSSTYRIIQSSNPATVQQLNSQQAQALFDRLQAQQKQMQENFNKMVAQTYREFGQPLPMLMPSIVIIQPTPPAKK